MKNALITWMSEKKGEKKKEGSVGVFVLWLSGCCVVVVVDVVCIILR